ncbi:MAG TPA: 4-alpha-glucanotransferase [Acidimicrobiales bacterium]
MSTLDVVDSPSHSFEEAHSIDQPAFAFDRASGVLCHLTSLPGGRLGSEALRYIDWLNKAGQRWWQILPLGPPDRSGSPYLARSAFACSPALLARPEARVTTSELDRFVGEHSYWAEGWARYGGRGALENQVRFQREWSRLRLHAVERGVQILGDMPFYVARRSADHLVHPNLFRSDRAAGVPPDDWSATGQLWGNPTYNWQAMRKEGFRWWIERFRRTFELVDAARVDHFRGFIASWSVPYGISTAMDGGWRRSPGRELFAAVQAELGRSHLVAENLGVITPPVERLRLALRLPGTIVLQFVFGDEMLNRHRDEPGVENVVYTGTHDNDTTLSWWGSAGPGTRANVERALDRAGIHEISPNWKLIRLALAHPAAVAILPVQDLLGLDGTARFNFPGRSRGNWRWQMQPGMLTSGLARRLRDLTVASSRA